MSKRIYTEINNGVYRCGFAGSQEAYEAAYDRLFTIGMADSRVDSCECKAVNRDSMRHVDFCER